MNVTSSHFPSRKQALAPIANKTSDDMVQALTNVSPFKFYLHAIFQYIVSFIQITTRTRLFILAQVTICNTKTEIVHPYLQRISCVI